MKLKYLYLLLCVFGVALPMRHFYPFLVEHGLDVSEFMRQIYATDIGAFFSADVTVSAVVLLVFMWVEGKRISLKNHMLPVFGLIIGVSLSLPWFLYMRQSHLDKIENHENS